MSSEHQLLAGNERILHFASQDQKYKTNL